MSVISAVAINYNIFNRCTLNENLIVGPLPMLNPPLLIPLDEKSVKVNDLINVKLKYIMGNGIESIETHYL